MMIRILAVAAFATISVAAHAGTIQNGVWTPSKCGPGPGPAPVMDDKSGATYTKSAKEFQAWQGPAKEHVACLTEEAKADQTAIVDASNKAVTEYNDSSNNFVAAANAAMEKLKGKAKK